MKLNDKIYVAGHTGMAGSAICRRLRSAGFNNLVLKSSRELDLRDQQAVRSFFEQERPDLVFLAAAKVGGIMANQTYRAEFIYDNLQIQNNVIHNSYLSGVKKLLFLGSSCIYPRDAPQPIKEEYLLTGQLEYTNEPYAIAKIAGIKMCEAYRAQYGCNFISAMPTNLYGPGDNYHPVNSHVLPALIRRFHEAKISGAESVTIWGTGNPMREFLFSNDLADACIFLMQHYNGAGPVNIGTGTDLSIRELAGLIKEIIGYQGDIQFDPTKPDGTPRKLLDVSRLKDIGWQYTTPFEEGISLAYADFLQGELKELIDMS